jgi:hypothetical protein
MYSTVWVVGVEVPVKEGPPRKEQEVAIAFASQINAQVLSLSPSNRCFVLSPNRE